MFDKNNSGEINIDQVLELINKFDEASKESNTGTGNGLAGKNSTGPGSAPGKNKSGATGNAGLS